MKARVPLRDRPDPRRKMLKYLVTLFALFAIGYAQRRCSK